MVLLLHSFYFFDETKLIKQLYFLSLFLSPAPFVLGQRELGKEKLTNNVVKLYNKEFKNRTENEIFQMIYKANQMEEEYEEEFSYLPILPNSIWRYCNVGLDETIDAYLLTITSKDDEIKFIWKGWREPCGKEQIGVLNSVMVKKEIVIKTIIECLNLVKQDMRNYKMK
jgi:hypothetical protein